MLALPANSTQALNSMRSRALCKRRLSASSNAAFDGALARVIDRLSCGGLALGLAGAFVAASFFAGASTGPVVGHGR